MSPPAEAWPSNWGRPAESDEDERGQPHVTGMSTPLSLSFCCGEATVSRLTHPWNRHVCVNLDTCLDAHTLGYGAVSGMALVLLFLALR